MATSFQQLEPLLSKLDKAAKLFKVSTEVIEQTNKRTIFWCADKNVARNLAFRINDEGFALEIRKGLKSNSYYVQAFY